MFSRVLMVLLGPAFAVLSASRRARRAGWAWSRLRDAAGAGTGAVVAAPEEPLLEPRRRVPVRRPVRGHPDRHAPRVDPSGTLRGGVLRPRRRSWASTDVDPFIMGMTQAARATTPVGLAAGSIVIAAASNNALKGGYAFFFADRATGRDGLLLLLVLACAGPRPAAAALIQRPRRSGGDHRRIQSRARRCSATVSPGRLSAWEPRSARRTPPRTSRRHVPERASTSFLQPVDLRLHLNPARRAVSGSHSRVDLVGFSAWRCGNGI